MAKSPNNKTLVDGIQVALDAADTASGVVNEFNNVREQLEVVNIQDKRIYQSVLIIFVSAIVAAIISLGAGLLMYYKALGTLKTNSNMAIESLAIFTENVSSLDASVKTVETNTQNQEVIKASLDEIKSAAEKAEPVVVEGEQDLPLRLELRQLVWSRSKCCWPTGDPKKNGFVFCGDAVVPGKPYCLPHCQEAYTTSRDAS